MLELLRHSVSLQKKAVLTAKETQYPVEPGAEEQLLPMIGITKNANSVVINKKLTLLPRLQNTVGLSEND